jgi:hypothetical protein
MKGFLFIYLFIKLLIKIKDMIPKNQFLRRGFLFNFFFNVDKIATSKRKENVHNFGYKQDMVFFRKINKYSSMLWAM